VRPQQGSDGSSRLFGVVEGNLREEMVNDVVINNIVEEVTAKETAASIDRTYSSLGERPRRGGVVWY